MDDNSEIAEKITAMETEQAESLRIKQAALQKMNEADAMIQRQQGYLIALRELLQSSGNDNGEVDVIPEAGEVIL
jgi:hypothetical protein|tara:strand:- start:541 stop:765 length:225 start_codon:yes stop_codon:yes gene_type:complete